LQRPSSGRQDRLVWRRPEPALDRETVDGIIRMLMEIDAKLELVVAYLGLGEGDEEEEDDA
jgi:hypothetical protein